MKALFAAIQPTDPAYPAGPRHRSGQPACAHRHHHGRQRPLGQAAPPAARGGTSGRRGRGASRRWKPARSWAERALTLYAFSVENWKRPRFEVDTLWSLLKVYLLAELPLMMRHDIRFTAMGRLDALPAPVRASWTK